MFYSQWLGTQEFVTWQFIHALLCDALTSEINNNETKAEAMELEISEAEVLAPSKKKKQKRQEKEIAQECKMLMVMWSLKEKYQQVELSKPIKSNLFAALR